LVIDVYTTALHHAAMRKGIGLGTVLLLACGSSSAPPNTGGSPDGGPKDGAADAKALDPSILAPAEGSRLKIRWAQGPGGRRTFNGWYDTMLKAECNFRRAVDGEWRCLPTAFTMATTPNDFSDPACTAPAAVYSNASCEPPEFIRRVDTTNACQSRERIYARGERIAENRTFWRPDGPMGRCAAGAILDTSAAFRLGPELPVTMFVRGKDVVKPAADRSGPFDPILFEIDDGARGFTGWQNPTAGSQCVFWSLADGRQHCMPPTATLSTVTFSDNACKEQAAYFAPACGSAPTLVMRAALGTCPLTYAPLALGQPLDLLFRVAAGMCGPVSPQLGNEYHALGTAARPEDFPVLDFAVEESTERLRHRFIGRSGGPRFLSGDWYDADRKENCVLFSFGAGKYRCAPSAATRLGFLFADDTCSRPLLQVAADGCPSKYAYRFEYTVCPGRAQFFTVGARFTGPTFTRYDVRNDLDAHLDCLPTNPALPADQATYEVAPLAEDQFPEIQRTGL
jgi:hypothetical protein